MVEALPTVLALGHKRNSSTPAFLTPVLRNVVISLARLPLVNSYTRVPPLVSPLTPREEAEVSKPPAGGAKAEVDPRVLCPRCRAFQGVSSRHLSAVLGRGVQQSVVEMLGLPTWGGALHPEGRFHLPPVGTPPRMWWART